MISCYCNVDNYGSSIYVLFVFDYLPCFVGNFGSSIGSLFVFVRWVILLNLFLSLVWLSVVVIPTAVTFNYNNISQELEWMNFIDGEVTIGYHKNVGKKN